MMLKIGVQYPDEKDMSHEIQGWRLWDEITDIRHNIIDLNAYDGKKYYSSDLALVVPPSAASNGSRGQVCHWEKKPNNMAYEVIFTRRNGQVMHILFQGTGYILSNEGQTVEKIK